MISPIAPFVRAVFLSGWLLHTRQTQTPLSVSDMSLMSLLSPRSSDRGYPTTRYLLNYGLAKQPKDVLREARTFVTGKGGKSHADAAALFMRQLCKLPACKLLAVCAIRQEVLPRGSDAAGAKV